MSITTNIPAIIAALQRAEPKAMEAATIGMSNGAERFIGKIKSEQMSGRPGLNAPTGTLRRSWYQETNVDANDIVTTIATQSKYARIHQNGGTIYPVKAKFLQFKTKTGYVRKKSVTIPKRLRVIEDFLASGVSIIGKQIVSFVDKAISQEVSNAKP